METWKRIVYIRMNTIYESITAPPFLMIEDNRRYFVTEIENFLVQNMPNSDDHRMLFVYGIILPLEKHFMKIEDQPFISNITDRDSLVSAIENIKIGNFETYITKKILTKQTIPISSAHNYDGVGVGRGLKIPGTLQYWCATCKKYVGFTAAAYWNHQESVHNNPRVRVLERRVRVGKFKF